MDHAIGAVAHGQYGVIATVQLAELGLTRDHISYRVRVGRLLPVYHSVFAGGHRRLSKEGRWMASVLAGGPCAALSRRSATELWGLRSGRHTPADVTVPKDRRSRGGVVFHRSVLPADEITVHHGIRVTTVPRTLFDCATILRPRQLESAMNQAELQRLFDHLSLHDLLTRYPRRPGNDVRGLPRPQTNRWVEGFDVDCVWRRERIVAELDSRAFHDAQQAFESDRARDLVLSAAGWRPIRVTSRMLHRSRSDLERDLRRLLGLSAATLAA